MSHRLKITLAVAALQLLAAFPAAGRTADGAAAAPSRAAAEGRAPGARRALMTQGGGKKSRRKGAADALTPGVWGGAHVRFEVGGRGATVEYDCAHGTVEGRIVVDGRGRFGVAGMHYEERGGPSRPGGEAGGYAVRLSGVVGGSLMRLTVTRVDTKEVLGTFTLGRDREAELVKCR